jgi:hypothetical protein
MTQMKLQLYKELIAVEADEGGREGIGHAILIGAWLLQPYLI